VAKTIATISGIGLVPGVSKNRRWYTPEIVADAASRLDKRIRSGDSPPVMLSFHGAGDASREITATLTGARLDEGRLRFDAAITDTEAGRDIASLADTSDGKPAHLKNVSIRGFWTGTVRKVKGPDGEPAETAAGIDVAGIDWTKDPGVSGAEVDTFAWADRSGRSETTERVPIYESVQEARVTISEETAPAMALRLTEAERAMLPAAPHVFEDGLCATCAGLGEGGSAPGDGSKPYGDVQYADPGYQSDKKKRYPIDNRAHAKAALAYLSKKANAAKYTAAQLKRVMGRIRAACKKFGISVSTESAGWTFDEPAQVTEALAEYYGDPECAGAWSVSASNGPVNICLSSYRMDPEDLDVILRAAADAACKALAALDPDMDGDIDLPGAPASDTDHDGGESAPDDDPLGEAETETDPAASPAAATTQGTEDPAMAETTTPAAATAPAIDQKALAEAVTAAMAQQDEARRARKAEKRAARETAEAADREATAAKTAAESAALGQGIPATAGASVSETEDQRRARLARLVDEQFAAVAAKEGLTAVKTDEQLVAEMLEERMVPLRQARAENSDVKRKGLETLGSIAEGAPGTQKMLQECSNDDLARLAASAYPSPVGRR
jgi:hypothetical protein